MVVRTYNATQQTRTGVLTEVFEDIEYSSDGFRSIAKTAIPYARSKTITFEAKSLKPFTKLYVFFDKQVVNKYVTPFIVVPLELLSQTSLMLKLLLLVVH